MDKPTDPILLLKEIEAFITFRLTDAQPTFVVDDMREMKADIVKCIKTVEGLAN